MFQETKYNNNLPIYTKENQFSPIFLILMSLCFLQKILFPFIKPNEALFLQSKNLHILYYYCIFLFSINYALLRN